VWLKLLFSELIVRAAQVHIPRCVVSSLLLLD
jgi:hypothetical protein